MISSNDKRDFSDLLLREAFSKMVLELAGQNEKIMFIGADSVNNLRFKEFALKYPERLFDVGIAEQSMVGIAAGFATFGLIPFTGTMSAFISMRSCEQVRTGVAYPGLNVKFIGTHSGISFGPGGTTHHSTEDIAIFRSMANMTILVPADSNEAAKIAASVIKFKGPCYIRLPGGNGGRIYKNIGSCPFKIGRGNIIKDGTDLTMIATGPPCVQESLATANYLQDKGISVRVINMASVKPIDRNIIIKAAEDTGRIITVEDHNIIGGLGSAVAEVVTDTKPVPVKRVGVPDVYSTIGPSEALWEKYGIAFKPLLKTVEAFLKNTS